MTQWFEAARVGEIADRKCKAVAVNGSAAAFSTCTASTSRSRTCAPTWEGTSPRVGWKAIVPSALGTWRSFPSALARRSRLPHTRACIASRCAYATASSRLAMTEPEHEEVLPALNRLFVRALIALGEPGEPQ